MSVTAEVRVCQAARWIRVVDTIPLLFDMIWIVRRRSVTVSAAARSGAFAMSRHADTENRPCVLISIILGCCENWLWLLTGFSMDVDELVVSLDRK